MSYFRHAPLTFWSVILLVLVVMAGVGFLAASEGREPASALSVPADPPAADVEDLVTRMSGVYPALASGTGASWAKDYAQLASEARGRFLDSGTRPDLIDEWADVVSAANQLALVDARNPQDFTAKTGTLGSAVGRLSEAAHLNAP
jgi:hypothetical protein